VLSAALTGEPGWPAPSRPSAMVAITGEMKAAGNKSN